jgi:hypothetical protein
VLEVHVRGKSVEQQIRGGIEQVVLQPEFVVQNCQLEASEIRLEGMETRSGRNGVIDVSRIVESDDTLPDEVWKLEHTIIKSRGIQLRGYCKVKGRRRSL